MSALAEAVGADELRDARSQLPNGFDSLFDPPSGETGGDGTATTFLAADRQRPV